MRWVVVTSGCLVLGACGGNSISTQAPVVQQQKPVRITVSRSCAPLGTDEILARDARLGTTYVRAKVVAIRESQVFKIVTDETPQAAVFTRIDLSIEEVLRGADDITTAKIWVEGGTTASLEEATDYELPGLTTGGTVIVAIVPQSEVGPIITRSYSVDGANVILDGQCQRPGGLPATPFSGSIGALQSGKPVTVKISGFRVAIESFEGAAKG